MNPILIAGTSIVNLALIAYSIAIISEQRKKLVTNKVLIFMSIGVFFDIIATICMIIVSSKTAFTSHGLLGYSSLTVMLIDCYLLWEFRVGYGKDQVVGRNLNLYSRFAYIWWLVAYITGAIIVATRHML